MTRYYKCTDCKARFYEDEIDMRSYREYYEFWGSSVSEEVVEWHCPECGSVDIEECYGDIYEDEDEDYDYDEDEEEEDTAMIIEEN